MKQLLVLTRPERRLIIVLILILVATAWCKHHRDSQNAIRPEQTLTASPTPAGT
jgi:hypothetical protein